MTAYNSDSIAFTGCNLHTVVTDFHGRRLTSDVGILLLREVDKQLGLIDSIKDGPTAVT